MARQLFTPPHCHLRHSTFVPSPPRLPQRRDTQIETHGQGEGTNSLLLSTFSGGKAAAGIYSGAGVPSGPICWTVLGVVGGAEVQTTELKCS